MKSTRVGMIDWKWKRRGRFKAVWDSLGPGNDREWLMVTCPSCADAVRLQRSASYRRVKHEKLETKRRGRVVFIRKAEGQ